VAGDTTYGYEVTNASLEDVNCGQFLPCKKICYIKENTLKKFLNKNNFGKIKKAFFQNFFFQDNKVNDEFFSLPRPTPPLKCFPVETCE